jgi:hypothetical protein
MKPDLHVSGRGRISSPLLLMAIFLAGSALAADAPPKPAPAGAVPVKAADAPAKTESQREAEKLLKSMADYLAGLTNLTCTSASRYETVQANGQKIEFGETRHISLSRPYYLRVNEVSSDGASDMVLFDGKLITALSADDNVYAQAPQPPSLEDALVYFVRDLRMRMPLALLLSTHVRTELPNMVKEIDYVESTTIGGKSAHHLAGRSDSVDFQLWVAAGASPYPMRIVITYKLAPAQPRYAADISDWNAAPKFLSTTFRYSPAKDARKIPFAVQVLPPPAAGQEAASGEVKP